MNGSRKGVVGKFVVQSTGGDTEPPTDPTNLTASNITANGATLTWNASSDNVGVDHYNVSIDGNLVGTSTTTSFNVTGLSPLTTYNASVNAEDAAGNVSGDATTSFTTLDGGTGNVIAAYYFETGLDGWIDGGNDCARQASANSYEGSYSIRLRDDSSSSNAVSPTLDLSGNSQVSIEFHTYANSMETGEDFFVEFYNGSSYQVIGQYISGTDFSNGSFFTDTIVLDSGSYSFNANNNFRIRCDASANNDQIWFDQVIITGDAAMAPMVGDEITPSPEAIKAQALATANDIKLYPNPAQTILNIKIKEGQYDEIMIFSSVGNLVKTIRPEQNDISINVSDLASGMYFVRFVTGKLAVTKRFVKQ